jgi:hypothetical protein
MAALIFSGIASARAAGGAILSPGTTDFTIIGADGSTIIGHAQYSVTHSNDVYLLRGENRYDSGDYDIEVDKLAPAAGEPPRLVSFEHSFFGSSGSPLLVGHADLKSGDAECIDYIHGRAQTTSTNLEFPPDTYAGASLLVPIEYHLRQDPHDPIDVHAFNCAPGPRILALRVRAKPNERWPLWKGDVVGVEVQPDLGFWSLLLAPFIPRLRARFDPSNFDYLGGRIQRYYRGPWVTFVRSATRDNPSPGEAHQTSPSDGRN